MSTAELAPLFRSGKWGGVPADAVPEDFIRYMLTRDDLFPLVRTKLERELARSGVAIPAASDDDTGARPRSAKVEPLPDELQDDERFEAVVTCPSCGRRATMTGRLAVKT